jgi:hypothetical protein
VIDHDVFDDLHSQSVHVRSERPQRGEVSEVGIERGEVLRPIAVVGVDVGIGFHVPNDGRDPQRRYAELADVVEMILEPFPVSALVARRRPLLHVKVVVHVSVGEPVDEHLVDDLVAPVVDVGLKTRPRRLGRDVDTLRRQRGDDEGTAGGEPERGCSAHRASPRAGVRSSRYGVTQA